MSHTLYLFDVDGTLTHPRQVNCLLTFIRLLYSWFGVFDLSCSSSTSKLRNTIETLRAQLRLDNEDNRSIFRFIFAENGVDGYHLGERLGSLSMKDFLGQERMDGFLDYLDGWTTKLALPVERGPFIECRKALINFTLLGRSATEHERQNFIENDTKHHLRESFTTALSSKLTELSLRYDYVMSILCLSTLLSNSLVLHLEARLPSISSLADGTKHSVLTRLSWLMTLHTLAFSSLVIRQSTAAMILKSIMMPARLGFALQGPKWQ